jgi:hypothetical protein
MKVIDNLGNLMNQEPDHFVEEELIEVRPIRTASRKDASSDSSRYWRVAHKIACWFPSILTYKNVMNKPILYSHSFTKGSQK